MHVDIGHCPAVRRFQETTMYLRNARMLSVAILVFMLTPTVVHAVLMGVYEFDGGGDGTSWNNATNWEQVLDPDGLPISGNPATPPDAVTSAEIPLPGVVVNSAGQTALDVRIGTANGAGSVDVSSGQLASRDVFVGSNVNNGALSVSGGDLSAGDDITVGDGSIGTMGVTSGQVSTGDDLFINSGSRLDMSGGMISVGDRLILEDDGVLDLVGGEIVVDDDVFVFDNSQVTVSGGLLQVADKLRFDDDPLSNARMIIDGGIVRSNEFGDGVMPLGVVEINDTGVYQIELLSVVDAMDLINEGIHFVSTSGILTAFAVNVPTLPGGPVVQFTQISVVPGQEVPAPGSIVLLSLGLAGIGYWRRGTYRRMRRGSRRHRQDPHQSEYI